MSRLLVIDDDQELCELLDRYLTGQHDLVVLDVMMPRLNGFEVLRRIRASSRIPVIMLTARGDEVDRIVGLEIGADDYLPKPFNSRELVARIQAVLRRAAHSVATAEKGPSCVVVGDVVLNPGMRSVSRKGRAVELTSIEFSILEVLLDLAGQVVSRDVLVKKAMGRENSAYDRSIDVHISSLRKKLGPYPGGAERIKTVRSIGYLYALSRQATDTPRDR
jgi:two-component system response regulator CpxR